jgi:DNA-binding transcriptional MocR family regulator
MKQSIEGALGVWSDGPGPLHRKLSTALRAAAESGRLPEGERLPSERELAQRLAVSRSTVVTAYDTLRSEGLLVSRQGSGTRIRRGAAARPAPLESFQVSPVYRTLIDARDDVISLACAIFPAHPLVADAIREVVLEEGDKLLAQNGYLPGGLPALREGLAGMLSERGTPTSPDQVMVTTGAQQAVSLATVALIRPGDRVVVEAPSFSGTLDAFRTRGAELIPVRVDDDGVDVRGVAQAIAAARPAAIYVMPTYHNPTGALLAPNRRRDLAELVVDQGVPLIEDNALENAPLDDEVVPPVAAYAPADTPILTAGSFSKVAWGGLRVGWMRGPAPLIGRLSELKAMSDLGSPLLDQAVAARLVPQIDRLRDDQRAMLNRNLTLASDLLRDLLPSWRWRRPRGGPSLWIELPCGTASAFSQVALRYGVEVIPGEQMSPTGGDERNLRLPYTAEPPVLEETMRRLAQAWTSYAPSDAPRSAPRPVVV